MENVEQIIAICATRHQQRLLQVYEYPDHPTSRQHSYRKRVQEEKALTDSEIKIVTVKTTMRGGTVYMIKCRYYWKLELMFLHY